MNPLLTEDLALLAETMRTMVNHASNGDWSSLIRLDDQRRDILNFKTSKNLESEYMSFTQEPQTTAGHSTVVTIEKDSSAMEYRDKLITEICALDKMIMNAVQLNRQRLIDENRGLKAQIKAQEVYARACLMS